MFYRSLTLEPIHGGPYHGAVSFHLTLGDQSNKEIGIAQMVQEIVTQTQDFALRGAGIVVIDSGYNQDSEVMELLSILSDRGYTIVGHTLPNRKPAWLFLCRISRVLLDSGGNWLNYTVNEIAVTLDRNAEQPVIAPNNEAAARLLMVARKTKAADIFAYIRNSERGWNITYPSQGPFQLEFL